MQWNYIVIPLVVVVVAVLGSILTADGLKRWYKTIKKPKFTPDGAIIGQVWTTIFILATISALLVYNSDAILHSDPLFALTIGAFVVNAVLNIFWTYLFFNLHFIGYAVIEAAALALSVLTLIFLTLPISVWAAMLLVPYFIWVCFATYLTYKIWQLNR